MIPILKLLHNQKHLDHNFMIEFYNICINSNMSLVFYDNIVSILNAFIKLNTKQFDFINCRDGDGKNILEVLIRITHTKPLIIINMVDIAKEITENDKTYVICMDTLITACIRSCGHAKFCYDCVYICVFITTCTFTNTYVIVVLKN